MSELLWVRTYEPIRSCPFWTCRVNYGAGDQASYDRAMMWYHDNFDGDGNSFYHYSPREHHTGYIAANFVEQRDLVLFLMGVGS